MKNHATPSLEAAIKAALGPVLREDGFSGSGRTFRRVAGNWVHVLNVQSSRYGGSFAVNLGIHPLSIPDVLGNEPNPKKITESLCEFRRRLSEAGADQWWHHDSSEASMHFALMEVAATYRRSGRDLFSKAAGSNSGFNAISATHLLHGAYDCGGFGSTNVRMAFALARLRKSENKQAAAAAFTAFALAHLDGAGLLRPELEALAKLQ